MVSRNDILSRAVDDCMKELYSLAQPSIDWEDFKKECEEYSKKYKEWENWKNTLHPEYGGKSITECIGPKPYEFYYLSKDIMKDICDTYISAYKIDSQKELLDTIEILKNYCKNPIVDKYIEGELRKDGTKCPGYRGYEHPDNLEKEIIKIIKEYDDTDIIKESKDIVNKFFEFLDMAGDFYNWNGELNSFNVNIYMGPSPNSNKEAVIENWKKYKNKDIKIDEEQIKKEYYGEEDFD